MGGKGGGGVYDGCEGREWDGIEWLGDACCVELCCA